MVYEPLPGSVHKPKPAHVPLGNEESQAIMDTRIGITVAILAACLFIILAKRYAPKDKHWAYATGGTIVGYRLKV